MIGLLVFFGLGVVLVYFTEHQRTQVVLTNQMDKSRTDFVNYLQLLNSKIETHVDFEYTLWDSMVKFTLNPDRKWGQINFIPAMEQYNIGEVNVLNAKKQLIFQINQDKEIVNNPYFVLPQTELEKILTQKPDRFRFYIYREGILWEYRGSSIHPESDSARKQPPSGWYIVGTPWNRKFLDSVAHSTRSDVWLDSTYPGFEMKVDSVRRKMSYSVPLPGWDDQPVAWIYVENSIEWLKAYQRFSEYLIIIILIASGLSGLVLSLFLGKYIRVPLWRITQGLKEQSSDIIQPLINDQTEFGRIAHLVDDFFRQKAELKENTRFRDALLGNLPGMVFRCENQPDWPMSYVSEGIRNLLGLSPEEFLAEHRDYSRFIHPEDRERVWKEIQGGLDESGRYEIHYRIITIDGDVKHVWERGRVVELCEENAICLEGFITDVTQSALVHEKLLEQLNQMQLLNELYDRMSGFGKLNDVISRMETLLTEYLPIDRAGVSVYDKEWNRLVSHQYLGERSESVLKTFSQEIGYSISGTAFEKGVAIHIPDTRLSDIIPAEILEKVPIKSSLATPIIHQGEKFGVLRVDRLQEYRGFTTSEQEFMRLLADELGILIRYNRMLSELKESEERLRQSESLYREAIGQAAAIPYQKDYINNTFTYLGDGIEKLTGYKPREMTPELFMSLIIKTIPRGEMTNLTAEEAGKACRDGRLRQWQSDILIQDRYGLQKWVSDLAIQIKDNHNKVIGSLGILQEITERMNRENQLRQLSAAVEQNPTALVILDTEGRVEYANPLYLKQTGYSEEEVLGRLPSSLSPRLDQLDTTVVTWEAIRELESWQDERVSIKKNGQEYWEKLSLSSIKETDGQIKHYLLICEDISQQKRAERGREAISKLAQELVMAVTLEDVAHATLQTLDQFIGWDASFIFFDSKPDYVLVSYDQINGQRVDCSEQARVDVSDFDFSHLHDGSQIINRDPSDRVNKSPINTFGDVERRSASLIFVPILKNRNLVGVISIQSYRYFAYTNDELRIVESLSDLCAGALERANTRQELILREKELSCQLENISSLRKIDGAILGSLDLKSNLDVVLDQVINRVGVESTALYLYDSKQDFLRYVSSRGLEQAPLEGDPIVLKEDVAMAVIRHKKKVYINNLREVSIEATPRVNWMYRENVVTYIGIPLVIKGSVKGILEIYHRSPIILSEENRSFLETLAGQAAIAVDNATLFDKLQKSNNELTLAYDQTLEGWAQALDLRDKETEGHTVRVTELTVTLAKVFGFTEPELTYIRWGTMLHDIGKMGIPDRILNKPGPLDDEEWKEMKRHPEYAIKALSSIEYLHPALDIPGSHHERWNGSGYPKGLKGEEIPLTARIFMVVDVWDALRSDRPYRKGWSDDKVIAYIQENAGILFDPKVVDAFLKLDLSRQ